MRNCKKKLHAHLVWINVGYVDHCICLELSVVRLAERPSIKRIFQIKCL